MGLDLAWLVGLAELTVDLIGGDVCLDINQEGHACLNVGGQFCSVAALISGKGGSIGSWNHKESIFKLLIPFEASI